MANHRLTATCLGSNFYKEEDPVPNKKATLVGILNTVKKQAIMDIKLHL